MQFGQYSIFTEPGRFYLLQKIRQSLKQIICLMKGHDTKVIYSPSGRAKARVVFPCDGKVLFRCHRCWKRVPENKNET